MAEWIKVRKDLITDPDVIAISDDLGITRAQVVGHLVVFWSWADSHLANGHASSVTGCHVDDIVGLKNFASALQKVGWLRLEKNGLDIPNFDRHMSESAKTRALAAERKRKERVQKVSRSKRDKRHGRSVTRGEERRGTSPPRGSSPSEKSRRRRPGSKPGAAPPAADPGDRVAAIVGQRKRGTRFQQNNVKYHYREDGNLWRWEADEQRWKLVT